MCSSLYVDHTTSSKWQTTSGKFSRSLVFQVPFVPAILIFRRKFWGRTRDIVAWQALVEKWQSIGISYDHLPPRLQAIRMPQWIQRNTTQKSRRNHF